MSRVRAAAADGAQSHFETDAAGLEYVLSQCKSMPMCPPGRVRATEGRQTEYTIAISVSRSTLQVSFSSKFESLEIDPQGIQALSAVCDGTILC